MKLTDKHTTFHYLFWILSLISLLTFPQCTPPADIERVQESNLPDANTEKSPKERSVEANPPDTISSDKSGQCRPISLVDHSKWKKRSLSDDPFASMKTKEMFCAPNGTKIEDGVIEFDTNICKFHSVTQNTPIPLRKGQTLHLLYWHLELYNPTPAKGYVGVAFGKDIIYQNPIKIPKAAEFYDVSIELKNDIPKGTPLTFHIHNHGSNTWKLLSFETTCP